LKNVEKNPKFNIKKTIKLEFLKNLQKNSNFLKNIEKNLNFNIKEIKRSQKNKIQKHQNRRQKIGNFKKMFEK